MATIFRLFFKPFYKFNTCVQTFLWKSIIGYTAAQLIENYKKGYIFYILDLTEEMSALSVL